MRDGRPNPDIWGNIITCGEIAVGIYEIVGTKKRGLEVPKALAEEILPESVMEQAAQDGENLCFTDPVPTPSLRTLCWNRNLLLIRRQRPVWTQSGSLMMWPMIRSLNRLFQTMSWTGWTWKGRCYFEAGLYFFPLCGEIWKRTWKRQRTTVLMWLPVA